MSHVTVKYIYPSGKMQHSGCGFTLHINYYGMLQSKLSSFYSNEWYKIHTCSTFYRQVKHISLSHSTSDSIGLVHTSCLSTITPSVSLASEILEDAEEPVDVTEACEPRGDELLLAGEARLGDVSDTGRLDSWVVRLWTERSRSDRKPPPLTELYGVIQNEAWLVTRLECVGVLPSMLQRKQLLGWIRFNVPANKL